MTDREAKCPSCGGDAGDNWFDRSICPEPCGSMHTRCSNCGAALDSCPVDPGPASSNRVCERCGGMGCKECAPHATRNREWRCIECGRTGRQVFFYLHWADPRCWGRRPRND